MASETSDTTVTTITNNGSNINNSSHSTNNNNNSNTNNNTSNTSSNLISNTNRKYNNSNSSILSLDSSIRKFSIPISTKIDANTFGLMKRCIQYSTIISKHQNHPNKNNHDQNDNDESNNNNNSNNNTQTQKPSHPTEENYEQHIQKLKLQLLQNEHDTNAKQSETLQKKYLELQQNLFDLKKVRKSLKKKMKHQTIITVQDDNNSSIDIHNNNNITSNTCSSKEKEFELKIQKLQIEKDEMNQKLHNVQLSLNQNNEIYEKKKQDLIAKHESQKQERIMVIMKKRKLNDIITASSGNNNMNKNIGKEDDNDKIMIGSDVNSSSIVKEVGIAMEDDDNYEEGEVIEENDLPLKKKMKLDDENKDDKVMKKEEGEVLVDTAKMESELKVRVLVTIKKKICTQIRYYDVAFTNNLFIHFTIIMCTPTSYHFRKSKKKWTN